MKRLLLLLALAIAAVALMVPLAQAKPGPATITASISTDSSCLVTVASAYNAGNASHGQLQVVVTLSDGTSSLQASSGWVQWKVATSYLDFRLAVAATHTLVATAGLYDSSGLLATDTESVSADCAY